MATVQKVDQSMIKQYLEAMEFQYLTDADGDIQTRTYDEECGCAITSWFIVRNLDDDSQIFRVQAIPDVRIHKSDWGRALWACNTFMKDNVGTKVYLHVNDYDNDEVGTIVADGFFVTTEGIHQELLHDLTNLVVGTAYNFCVWAHQERTLW